MFPVSEDWSQGSLKGGNTTKSPSPLWDSQAIPQVTLCEPREPCHFTILGKLNRETGLDAETTASMVS